MRSISERSEPGDGSLEVAARPFDDPATLRLLVERLHEGLYITNARGDILEANPAMLEILGLESVDQLQAWRTHQLLVDPGVRETQLELLRRDGEVREFELEIRRPDGTVCIVQDTCFLVEPSDPGGARLIYGMVVDITRRKELEDRLREQSLRDALTGCYNRRYLTELTEELGDDPKRTWGVLVFDLDHFKLLNDELGHAEGDRVLVRMGRFLMGRSRGDDPVVRLGGDEFLVLLLDAGEEETRLVAERFGSASEVDAPTSYTLGWAVRRGPEQLYRTVERADRALIAARVRVRDGSTSTRRTDIDI